MMKKRMTSTIFNKATSLTIGLCIALAGVTQQGITVTATVDRQKILIGEPIELRLTANIPENEAIRFFHVDTIPHFEFLEKRKIDTSNTSNGTRLTQLIRITSFDSGQWVIPSFILADTIATDSIPVDISFSAFDPNQPYHDIKDVIDVEEENKKQWWWFAIGGGLLLLLILYLVLRKRTRPVARVESPPVDPYKEAMTELAALQGSRPEIKQFYSSLVDIFRLYVYRRKGLLSLQKTTDDLVVQLREISLNKEQFDRLAQALRLSDFVKFAKYVPTETDNVNSFDAIRESIINIEKSAVAAQQGGQ